MTIEDHKAVARRLLEELWSGGDVAMADELFTAGFLHHSAPEGTPRGPEGQKQFIPMIRAMVPGLRIQIDDTIAEGDRVAARWTGTYVTESGEHKSYPGVDILRFEDGRIAELWSFVP
ncbi:MAG TPA: ester cyclase [Thermomicrobiales bacterium]|nr:ester cyclase [Thermomicrobiales bacterium]